MDLSHFDDRSQNTGVSDPEELQRDLHRTVVRLLAVKDEKENLEEKLKTINREKEMLEKNEIPTKLQNMGLAKAKLDNGVSVSYKKDVSVSITDRRKFAEFLESFGLTDKFDLQVSIERDVQRGDKQDIPLLVTKALRAINEKFRGLIKFKLKYTLHHATQAKFWREWLYDDEIDTDEFNRRVKVIRTFANVFEFNKTSVRRPSVSMKDLPY